MTQHNPTPTRRQRLLQGIEVGHKQYSVEKSELTGMYRATLTCGYDDEGEPDVSTGIEEDGNYCSICLFIEDEPYNYGEIIVPTSYDGDCDDCHKLALPEAHLHDLAAIDDDPALATLKTYWNFDALLTAAWKEVYRLRNKVDDLTMVIATHEQTIERLETLFLEEE